MENKDIDKAAREIPQSEHDACNYANGILSKVRDEDFTLFPKSIIWAVAHDAYSSRQSEIDELVEAVEEATRWIPVSERLPEVGKSGISKEVIAYCPSVYKVLHYCKNSYYPNGAWFCASEELQSYPTHWRPIDTPKATQLLEKYGKK